MYSVQSRHWRAPHRWSKRQHRQRPHLVDDRHALPLTPGLGHLLRVDVRAAGRIRGGLPRARSSRRGNAWDNVNWGFKKCETFISTDYGVTWSSRGNCVTKSGSPSAISTGLWEPEIILNANGDLACHFSRRAPALLGLLPEARHGHLLQWRDNMGRRSRHRRGR